MFNLSPVFALLPPAIRLRSIGLPFYLFHYPFRTRFNQFVFESTEATFKDCRYILLKCHLLAPFRLPFTMRLSLLGFADTYKIIYAFPIPNVSVLIEFSVVKVWVIAPTLALVSVIRHHSLLSFLLRS